MRFTIHPQALLLACVSAALLTAAGSAHADAARAKKIAGGNCFLCHGSDGESTSEVFPRLAGQNPEYVAKQLAAFKSGARKSTAMADMAAKLTPDEMLALGHYYHDKPAVKEPPTDKDLAKVGEYVYHHGNKFSGVPACATCHGDKAEGAANLPRLAGQFSGYIYTQLKDFGKRTRNDDNAVMHAVAAQLTELEMAAVAEYLTNK